MLTLIRRSAMTPSGSGDVRTQEGPELPAEPGAGPPGGALMDEGADALPWFLWMFGMPAGGQRFTRRTARKRQ